MGGFREMSEAYGANYHSTMIRFMGNEAIYMKFLGMLFKGDDLEKLGEALKKQDYEETFSAAHTLKGAVGNMGLTPFFRTVCAVVEPLRVGAAPVDYGTLCQIIQAKFFRMNELRTGLKGGW